MREARLLYASSVAEADLLYATRFRVTDPVIFLQTGRKKTLVLPDLEIGRGRDEARVDEILHLSKLQQGLGRNPSPAQVIHRLLRQRKIRRVTVPERFPLGLADQLRARGIRVDWRPGPFYPERARKTGPEVRAIEEVQRAVEEAVERAVEILRRARIHRGRIIHQGKALTSEMIRQVIHGALLERSCTAEDTIVASGDQGCDPHQRGEGPLLAGRTIILDVFPRSSVSGYFADMTRTFVKGRASPEVKRMYAAVREAQELVFTLLRAGVDGRAVHRRVRDWFRHRGFRTGPRGRKMEGFFHGTGHGVGLEIHEAPYLNPRGGPVPPGAVLTVEPGLYYPGVGGVRLEDMVLVTRTGCRNLTRFPKVLEIP